MNYKKSIVALNEVIESLNMPKLKILNHLNHKEPIIYLCGKSTTGKTTFLNALFNFDKNELYTSTDVSTKTSFRFKYGLKNTLSTNLGAEQELPKSISERKELFRIINLKDSNHVITINSEVLNGREIIDIPGVFDHTSNNEYSDSMLDEADVVYFFTSWMSKVNNQEYGLLKNISESGIPIIVLFTMGDVTNADDGITRKAIPDFVEKRLASCFTDINVSHYQIISSSDFYKGKDFHGLDTLQSHIESHEKRYQEIATVNRLKRVLQLYINLIQSQITKYQKDQDRIVNLLKRENELWFSTEQQKISNQEKRDIHQVSNELQWLLKSCNESIYGKGYSKIISANKEENQSQKIKFIAFWEEFWNNLKITNENLSIKPPSLPSVDDTLFNPIKINEVKLEEIKKRFFNSTQQNTSPRSNSKPSEINGKDKVIKPVANKKPSEDKRDPLPTKKRISIEELIELGINLNNAKVLYEKWCFINELEKTISDCEKLIVNQIKEYAKINENDILLEKENKLVTALASDVTTCKLNDYLKHLDNLNNLLNEI